MNWQPKTEEEVMAAELCTPGKQPFTILEAAKIASKSQKNLGKEMLKLKLNVHADDGIDYYIYDYIAPWFMEYKFRHFFVAVNRLKVYEAGSLDDVLALVGAEGWCDLGIQKAKPGTQYGPKNIITDYVEKSDKATPAKAATLAPVKSEDDDIPF